MASESKLTEFATRQNNEYQASKPQEGTEGIQGHGLYATTRLVGLPGLEGRQDDSHHINDRV